MKFQSITNNLSGLSTSIFKKEMSFPYANSLVLLLAGVAVDISDLTFLEPLSLIVIYYPIKYSIQLIFLLPCCAISACSYALFSTDYFHTFSQHKNLFIVFCCIRLFSFFFFSLEFPYMVLECCYAWIIISLVDILSCSLCSCRIHSQLP